MAEQRTTNDTALRTLLKDLHARLNKARRQIECAPYRHAVRPLAEIEQVEADIAGLFDEDLVHFCECGNPVFATDDVLHFEDGPGDPCLDCTANYERDAVALAQNMILGGHTAASVLERLEEDHGHIRGEAWLTDVASKMQGAAA